MSPIGPTPPGKSESPAARLVRADSARRLAWNEYQAAYEVWVRAKDAVVLEQEREVVADAV